MQLFDRNRLGRHEPVPDTLRMCPDQQVTPPDRVGPPSRAVGEVIWLVGGRTEAFKHFRMEGF